MRVKQIIWLPEMVDKLQWKHNVSVTEIEALLFDTPQIYFVERGHRDRENLYTALGQTDVGRYLVVFFVLKKGNQALAAKLHPI